MPSKVELQIAEQVLAGNRAQPAYDLLLAGLRSFQGVRGKLREVSEPVLTARNKVVRCKLKRGAKLELYVGYYTFKRREIKTEEDPETQLTKRTPYTRTVTKQFVIGRLIPKSGSPMRLNNCEEAAREIAARCRGDAELVARVCGAIERGRRRLFELAEQATRWF